MYMILIYRFEKKKKKFTLVTQVKVINWSPCEPPRHLVNFISDRIWFWYSLIILNEKFYDV